MKATGIVRQIDSLGRVVLPKELRNVFAIQDKDSLEIFVEEDAIILKKYEPACAFCGDTHGLILYEGKNICAKCVDKMYDLISKKR